MELFIAKFGRSNVKQNEKRSKNYENQKEKREGKMMT